jgi:hypothetical protein
MKSADLFTFRNIAEAVKGRELVIVKDRLRGIRVPVELGPPFVECDTVDWGAEIDHPVAGWMPCAG